MLKHMTYLALVVDHFFAFRLLKIKKRSTIGKNIQETTTSG